MDDMNAYEVQRQQIIARNRARLLALGIPQAIEGLTKLAPAKKPRAPRPKHPAEPAEPSRQSSRLRDREMISRGEVPPDVEEGSELAIFIIDGECPRCGKVLSVGHARHLEVCKGPPEPPTEEEVAAKAEAYRSQQKDKLKELELGGLVDFQTAAAAGGGGGGGEPATERQQQEDAGEASGDHHQQQQKDKGKKASSTAKLKGKQAAAAAAAAADGGEAFATFIVIGSRGDHYVIKITDDKRTCQCLDHRFRHHDCKHIRLILQQLGVAEHPANWQQALCQQLDALGAADADDVQRVKQATQRAQAQKQKAVDKQAAAAAHNEAAAAAIDGAEAAGADGKGAAERNEDPSPGAGGGKGRGGKRKAAGKKRKAAS